MGSAGRIVDTVSQVWRGRRERRVPFLAREAIEHLQAARLRTMVEHAYRTVPFYRAAMDERGLRPGDLRSVADLACLPLVDATDVQKNTDAFVSSAFTDAECQSLHSTGTAGSGRRQILWDNAALLGQLPLGARDREVLYALLRKRWGLRRLSLFPAASTTRAILRYQQSRVFIPRLVQETRYVSLDQPYEAIAQEMNRFRPHVVFSYGSVAEHFCRFVVDRGLPVHPPRAWVCGADKLSDEGRALLEERLGCSVHSTYQSVEGGRIGFLCEAGRGFHLNVDVCPVRIVGSDGESLPDGESGEVLVSNLVNRATVLLNYRQGDRGALSTEPCACGRSLPRLERLEGRMSEVLHLADGREVLDNVLIHTCKEALKEVLQFQIVERGPGSFWWCLVPCSGVNRRALEERLLACAFDVLGPGDALTMKFVDRIEPTSGGKLLRVVREPASSSTGPTTGEEL